LILDNRYSILDTRCKQKNVSTGTGFVVISGESKRMTVACAGANARVGEAEVNRVVALLNSPAHAIGMLLIALEVPIPMTRKAAAAARARGGCFVALKPSPLLLHTLYFILCIDPSTLYFILHTIGVSSFSSPRTSRRCAPCSATDRLAYPSYTCIILYLIPDTVCLILYKVRALLGDGSIGMLHATAGEVYSMRYEV
jgi:hypothetical protein